MNHQSVMVGDLPHLLNNLSTSSSEIGSFSGISSRSLSPTEGLLTIQRLTAGIVRPDALTKALQKAMCDIHAENPVEVMAIHSVMSNSAPSPDDTSTNISTTMATRRNRVKVDEMTEEELRRRHEGRLAHCCKY